MSQPPPQHIWRLSSVTLILLSLLLASCGNRVQSLGAAGATPPAGQTSSPTTSTASAGKPKPTLVATVRPSASPEIDAKRPFTVQRSVQLSQHASARQLAFAGGMVFASVCDTRCELIRLDPATGQVSPVPLEAGVRDMTVAAQQLWVAIGSSPGQDPANDAAALVEVDPASLVPKRTIALSSVPNGLVFAGDQLWLAMPHDLTAVNPQTGTITHDVPVDTGDSSFQRVIVGASGDGTMLWTATFNAAGGRFPVQLRDATDGQVIAATQGPGAIGPTSIAATADHAWISFSTGMLGSYVRMTLKQGELTRSQTPPMSYGPLGRFANGVSVHLNSGELWIVDDMSGSVACARDSDGQILARTPLNTVRSDAFAPLPNGRIALAGDGQVLIVKPRSICEP